MKMKNKSNKIINNINEESKASLIVFRQKQILTNIKYHKVLFFNFYQHFLSNFHFFLQKKNKRNKNAFWYSYIKN